MILRVALAVLLAAQVAACGSYRPFDAPVISDIPEGPGLFSGEDGEFVIFRR